MQSKTYTSKLNVPLGGGAFGRVFVGHKKNDENMQVAVKEIPNDLRDGGHFCDSAKKEFNALQKACDHLNIVQFLEFHSTERFLYLILELCDLGHLETYVKRTQNLSLHKKVDIMKQCADGVSYLHSLKPPVIHRDLKPENILMKANSESDIVKITDFGLAKVLEDGQEHMSTDVGTPIFRAPELFVTGRKQYTSAVDVFSLGLVYLVLLKYNATTCTSFKPYEPEGPWLAYGQKLLLCQDRTREETPPVLFELTSVDDPSHIEISCLIAKMIQSDSKKRLLMKIVASEVAIIKDKMDGKFAIPFQEYQDQMSAKDSIIETLDYEITPKNTAITDLENNTSMPSSQQDYPFLQNVIEEVANENSRLQHQVKKLQDQLHSKEDVRAIQHQDQQRKELEEMQQQMGQLVMENEQLVDKNKFLQERVGDLPERLSVEMGNIMIADESSVENAVSSQHKRAHSEDKNKFSEERVKDQTQSNDTPCAAWIPATYGPIQDLKRNWHNYTLVLQDFNKYLQNVNVVEIKPYIDSIAKYKKCRETLYKGLEVIASGITVSMKANNSAQMQQLKASFECIQKNFRDLRKDCKSLVRVSSSRRVIEDFIRVSENINSTLREVSKDKVLLLTFFKATV